jgi:hypothetical protein
MKAFYITVIVVLLVSIVAYMATDRREKDVAHQRDTTFDADFAK